MDSNVSKGLVCRLPIGRLNSGRTTAEQFRHGTAAGANWAQRNIFGDAEQAPLTTNVLDAAYNLGVMHGIASELRRVADTIDASSGKSHAENLRGAPGAAVAKIFVASDSFVPFEDDVLGTETSLPT